MKVNLEASIDNLLFLDYMEKQQKRRDTESNEDQNDCWCCYDRPQEQKED